MKQRDVDIVSGRPCRCHQVLEYASGASQRLARQNTGLSGCGEEAAA